MFVGGLVQEGLWSLSRISVTDCGNVVILYRISVTNRGKLGIFEGNYFLDNCRKICPGGTVEFVQDFL